MAALLLVGDLVLDLQRAGARLDHLLGEQIGRLGIAETGVDIGDDRHDMGFMPVDRGLDAPRLDLVAALLGGIELVEHHPQLAGIGLLEEGIDLANQPRDAGFLVHRLVGKGAEIAAQRGDHPARQVEIAAFGGAEMLFDRDHLLLCDEAVPAAERLGVVRRIGIISRHIRAHDLGGVFRDVEAGGETVLDLHPCRAFGVDRRPWGAIAVDGRGDIVDGGLIGHELLLGISLQAPGGFTRDFTGKVTKYVVVTKVAQLRLM